MSAAQEDRLNSFITPEKIGIISGGGQLPFVVVEACEVRGIKPFIVAFDGHTCPDLVDGQEHIWTRMGAVGKILKSLRARDITDIVLIGNVRRPSLAELRPDLKAAAFFARSGFSALGDDGLLKALRSYLEDEGFRLHGAHSIAQELLAEEGFLGKHKPIKADYENIQRGIEVLRGMSALDVGQAVIVQEGLVLGVEAVEGTDALIERCKHLKRAGRGGVLVKLAKIGQDKDMDLPTIGPRTVELAVETGLSGIVVQAGHSLLLQKDEVAALADAHKLFVMGVNPENDIKAGYS